MKRKTGIKRYTPLARSKKRIPRIRPERRREKATYKIQNVAYLEAHPFCQITIAIHRQTEERILANNGFYTIAGVMRRIPFATQVHHRNKCRGARLTDERFFMSACDDEHWHVENGKAWAREIGNQFLLPLEADADGRTPDGRQWLTTPELLEARARGGPP